MNAIPPISPGDKFVVVVPIDVAEDVHWSAGTIVECSEVLRVGDSFSCEMHHNGIDASFADIDVFGEYRWFDPVEAGSNPFA